MIKQLFYDHIDMTYERRRARAEGLIIGVLSGWATMFGVLYLIGWLLGY